MSDQVFEAPIAETPTEVTNTPEVPKLDMRMLLAPYREHYELSLEETLDGEIVLATDVPYDAYLKNYEGQSTEWVRGTVIQLMGNNIFHNLLLSFLHDLFRCFLAKRKIKAKVLLAGVSMYLGDDKSARQPDLIVVMPENLTRLKPTFLNGIGDIVVEIVSPESAKRDKDIKLNEYERAGVPEYWLFDPRHHDITAYELDAEDVYRSIPADAQGRFSSSVLKGLVIDPKWIWDAELPDYDEIAELVIAMLKEQE
jgi:Uma2 family endonuclease